jgi:hypothetical protein
MKMATQQDAQIDKAVSQVSKPLDQLTTTMQQIANCLGFLAIRFSDYRKKPNTERIPFLALHRFVGLSHT